MKCDKCVLCGSDVAKQEYCRRCLRRVDVWGIDGARMLIEIARSGTNIDMEYAKEFCRTYYSGKVTKSHERVGVMKTSLEILGYKGAITGRHHINSPTYEMTRRAN